MCFQKVSPGSHGVTSCIRHDFLPLPCMDSSPLRSVSVLSSGSLNKTQRNRTSVVQWYRFPKLAPIIPEVLKSYAVLGQVHFRYILIKPNLVFIMVIFRGLISKTLLYTKIYGFKKVKIVNFMLLYLCLCCISL